MVAHSEKSNDMFSDEELLLKDIQERCAHYADEIINRIIKRAIRVINTWPVSIIEGGENYPNRFSTFDILCCEHQSKYWHEINPFLEEAIEGTISSAYDSLPAKDKFFIEYSECFYHSQALETSEIDKMLKERFVEFINQHWSNSNKIQNFELKKTW